MLYGCEIRAVENEFMLLILTSANDVFFCRQYELYCFYFSIGSQGKLTKFFWFWLIFTLDEKRVCVWFLFKNDANFLRQEDILRTEQSASPRLCIVQKICSRNEQLALPICIQRKIGVCIGCFYTKGILTWCSFHQQSTKQTFLDDFIC